MAVLCAASMASADRLRAPDGTIKNVPDESVEFALKEGYRRLPTVYLRSPDGAVLEYYEDQAPYMIERGYWKMTDAEVSAHINKGAQRVVDEILAEREAKERRERWMMVVIVAGLLAIPLIAAAFTKWARKRIGRGIVDK